MNDCVYCFSFLEGGLFVHFFKSTIQLFHCLLLCLFLLITKNAPRQEAQLVVFAKHTHVVLDSITSSITLQKVLRCCRRLKVILIHNELEDEAHKSSFKETEDLFRVGLMLGLHKMRQ